MIDGKRILAVIPARGGSKRIPDKNIKLFCGHPLIKYSIDAAKGSKYLDRVIVNTEDTIIAKIAEELGANIPFMRDASLASDSTSSVEVILDTIRWFESKHESFDILVVLQPTSPLRNSNDIDTALELMINKGSLSLVAVNENHEKEIFYKYVDDKGVVVNEQIFDVKNSSLNKLNGALFIMNWTFIKSNKSYYYDNTIAFPMPAERSIDIDTPLDFEIAEYLYDKKKPQ